MSTGKSELPNLSPQRAAELLRAGMALVADHIGTSFTAMCAPAIENLASRIDADQGAPSARRLLSGRRDDLRRGFLAHLKQAQEAALGRLLKRDKATAGPAKRISAETLTLMDDDALGSSEAVSRVARRIQGTLETPLREVHLLASFLAGRDGVRVGDDPFTPEVVVKSLADAAGDAQLEANGYSSLLGAFEQPLAEQIGVGYQNLLAHLRKSGIEPAAVRREMAARQATGKGASAGPITRNSAAARLGWMEEVPRVNAIPPPTTVAHTTVQGPATVPAFPTTVAGIDAVAEARASLGNMMARMQADLRGTTAPPPIAAAGSPPADLLRAIDEMQHVGSGEIGTATKPGVGAAGAVTIPLGTAPSVGQAGPDQGAWRDLLLAKSSRTVDKLTIEIVGMLFDHVLQDTQVPAEIKAVLSRLQFPVLKVALTDAEFFVTSNHPARRLIDRLASTAIGWEPYGDENTRYKTEVEHVVQQVLEKFDKDMSIFEQLLTDFDDFVSAMPTRETDPVARAKRALEEAEKREVLVINTTIQVRRAFEHVEIEPFLREFLVGPWVQALVTATLRDEQTPGFSKAFRQVIHDLVWSVQPKVSADERKRLVAVIPTMTRILRDGLSMIRTSEHDQQQFLKQLMASHAVAVRPVDQATYIKSSVATKELRQRLDEMHITGTFPIEAGSGVRVSVDAVQRAAENHAAQLVMPEPIVEGGPIDYDQEAELDEQIAGWQRGSWFNFYDGKEVIKVKLRWVSPLRTLFMFSSGEEKSARVLSPETIKSYLKKGYLKPLEAVPLTKRVVDRVVGDLERSPKRAQDLASRIGGMTQPGAA